MKKVIIFHNRIITTLESDINEFLEEANIEILDMKFSTTVDTFDVLIYYKIIKQ